VKRIGVVAFVAMLCAVRASPVDVADFEKGETLDYELTWLHLTGGSMRMTVSATSDRLRITSIAKSSSSFARIYKVRDQIESLSTTANFSTVQYHKALNENGKIKDDNTTIDTAQRIATRRKGSKTRVFRIVPPPPYADPLSIVYKLRLLDLTPNSVQHFTLYADGNVYAIEARVGERTNVTTPAGTFATVPVEPKMNNRGGLFGDEDSRLIIWFSDNVQHIPVRIRTDVKFGSVTANLRGIRAGVTSIEPGK
jgi:hypothetical protein